MFAFVVCGSDEEAEMLRECASSECEAMPAASLIPANTGTDLDLIINCDAHVVDVLCRVYCSLFSTRQWGGTYKCSEQGTPAATDIGIS
jgi:hypothetical protein